MVLHRLGSSFFFRSSLFVNVLTWVKLLQWMTACSVANGEASTSSLVTGDLPRRSGVVFPDLLIFLWFLSFLRRLLQQLEVSNAAGGVFLLETYRRLLFLSPESCRSFIFWFFHFRSGRLKCSRARFVRFSFSIVAGQGFYLVNGPYLLVSLL